MNFMYELFMFYLYGSLNAELEKNYFDNVKIMESTTIFETVSEINS